MVLEYEDWIKAMMVEVALGFQIVQKEEMQEADRWAFVLQTHLQRFHCH